MTDETVTIELARSHAAAERSYQYGIPTLIVVGAVASIVFALILWALVTAVREMARAVRELAASSRATGAAVALVGGARSAGERESEERDAELLRLVGEVHAAVVSGGRRE